MCVVLETNALLSGMYYYGAMTRMIRSAMSANTFTATALALALYVPHYARADSAQAGESAANTTSGVVDKVERTIERGAKTAASGVKRGVKATGSAVERGAKAAAKGIERGGKAAASGVERGAKATGKAVDSVAEKVVGSSKSSSAPGN